MDKDGLLLPAPNPTQSSVPCGTRSETSAKPHKYDTMSSPKPKNTRGKGVPQKSQQMEEFIPKELEIF